MPETAISVARGYLRALRTLSECGRVLVRAGSEQDLLDATCRIMVDVGGYRLAWIGYVEGDGSVRPVAQTGFEQGFLASHRVSTREDTPSGHGVVGTCIRGRAPAVIRDAQRVERYRPWRHLAVEYGFHSVLGLPLIVAGEPMGAMVYYSVEEDAFAADEIALLQEVAEDLAYGIYTRRLKAQNEETNQTLRATLTELSAQKQALDRHAIVSIADVEGRIIYANDRFCELSQYPREELLGRGYELFAPANAPNLYPDVGRITRGGEVWQGEICNRRKDGSLFWVEATVVPFRNPEGEIYQYVTLATDVTAIKAVQAALEALNRELEDRVRLRTRELERAQSELKADIVRREAVEQQLRQANEALLATNRRLEEAQAQLLQSEKMASIGQLAAGVAHEINNPVGYVSANLGILRKYVGQLLEVAGDGAAGLDFLREDLPALIRESEEGLERVKKIVQDLKEFSHTGGNDWEFADLHRGLDSTLNIVHNEIKYRAEVVKRYGELPPVECLPSQLNQVFMNLLVNAAQAMKGHGVITVSTGAESREVWVEVADTGEGIPPENRSRIFDAFFTTKPVGKGTGLGLSLAYSIVKKHHGRIEVDSELGKGTRFRVWLPVRQPDAST